MCIKHQCRHVIHELEFAQSCNFCPWCKSVIVVLQNTAHSSTETAELWGGCTWHGALSICIFRITAEREKGRCCRWFYTSFTSLLCKTTHTNTSPSQNHTDKTNAHTHTLGRCTSKANNGILLHYNVTRPLLTGMAPRQTKTAGRLWWAEWKCVSVSELLHRLTVTSVHSLSLSLHFSIPHRRVEKNTMGRTWAHVKLTLKKNLI